MDLEGYGLRTLHKTRVSQPGSYKAVPISRVSVSWEEPYFVGSTPKRPHKHKDPKNMISGSPLVLGLGTRMKDSYVYAY